MQTIRLTVKRGPSEYDGRTWRNARGTEMICMSEALAQLPDLDEDKPLFAVFTKRESGDHDFFALTSFGKVTAFDGAYYNPATKVLRRLYREGERFVHFEQPA